MLANSQINPAGAYKIFNEEKTHFTVQGKQVWLLEHHRMWMTDKLVKMLLNSTYQSALISHIKQPEQLESTYQSKVFQRDPMKHKPEVAFGPQRM